MSNKCPIAKNDVFEDVKQNNLFFPAKKQKKNKLIKFVENLIVVFAFTTLLRYN